MFKIYSYKYEDKKKRKKTEVPPPSLRRIKMAEIITNNKTHTRSTQTSEFRRDSASLKSPSTDGTSPVAQDNTTPRRSMSSSRRVCTGWGRLERDAFSLGAMATDVRNL